MRVVRFGGSADFHRVCYNRRALRSTSAWGDE
jgi:hypothetical protein